MSVQRGMIVNYMIPVFCLMILTALYCIKGIGIFNIELNTLQANSNLDTLTLYNTQIEVVMGKKCSNIDAVNLRASKSCLRRLCAMQTMYDLVWFFLVLALENIKEGSSMAVVYAFTSCCLVSSCSYSTISPSVPTVNLSIVRIYRKMNSIVYIVSKIIM